jgi:peptidoglycan hydrolase CwlO-like protein
VLAFFSIGTFLAGLLVIAFVLLHRLDRSLEGDMLIDPRPTIQTRIRRYLGTDILPRLETLMATAKEQLTGLQGQFTDFAADVDAKLDQLQAAQGEFSPEAQEVFDQIKQAVADADAKVGDADGSDTVTPPVVDEANPNV